MRAAQAKFSDPRRTVIIEDESEFSIEDLIADEDVAITVTDTGYIKRTPISTYRQQRRGGKGRIGMRTRDEDVVNHLFVASTHSFLMIFTDRGRAYWLKVHEIPDVGADGNRREDRVDGGGARVRRPAPCGDGHEERHDQEDGTLGLLQPACRRHHRHGHRRG
jgi:DNA gyrase/topoisomerase IV subunit A